jgi:hypothetical protein
LGDEIEMERRMTTVENWQTNHDVVCAARWGILIKLIGWGGTMSFTVVLGLAGWGLKTLYDGQQQQNAALQQLIAKR